ncbi:MAG TPA: TonB-dependent receptor [Vitreimonas sp.]|uniref:TonB-dependent receptor n=1 Tax=Vitreimonas sp. TaxID=3069702 RepID=UPI002D3C862B|nr:TonB-dependent receptor [Vitreimonas sp.]HYD86317.1 TonB-dependent receptor [Vitreimonas sp.]
MDGAVETETIVVTAPRLPAAEGEAVYSSLPIDPATLEEALRLDQALAVAPAANLFRRNDSGAANPTVQGLSLRAIGPSGAGRALVTLDGAPQHDPFGGWVIWGALAPELIARANVIRGAGAGPYGAGALTGVIDLEERTAPGFSLRAEHGERDYTRVAGVGGAGDERFSALLAAFIEHDDGWIPTRESRGAADAPLWRDAMSGAARVQAMQGDMLISARLSGYAEERGSGLVGADSSADGAAVSLTLVQSPRADALGWRLQAWARESDMSNSFVAVSADRSTTTPAALQYATPAFGWGANAALRWSNAEIGLDLRASDGETRERFFFAGGEFTRSRVAGGATLSAGAYAEGWRTFGETLLSGGVRLDWWSASEGRRLERNLLTGAPTLDVNPEDRSAWAPTARLGVRRALGELDLRAAAYAGFRPPTLNELHRPFRVGNDVTEANPALDPEQLYGVDAAIGHESEELSWSVGVFAVQLVDPITNVTLGMGPGTFPPGVNVPAGGAYRQRLNAGVIEAVGVEADARGAWSDALSWRAALSYTDAEVDGEDVAPQLTGLRPAQAPAWSATAGLAWRPWAGGELGADLRYESARFDDDLNTRRLEAALTLDLRYEQDVTANTAVFVALDNALDAAIETGATADDVTLYGAPRSVRIGLRLTG